MIKIGDKVRQRTKFPFGDVFKKRIGIIKEANHSRFFGRWYKVAYKGVGTFEFHAGELCKVN